MVTAKDGSHGLGHERCALPFCFAHGANPKTGRLTMGRACRLLVVFGILVAGLMLAAPPAQAITFNLTSDHCTGTCGTAPFGTVDVTQVGANVHVVVDLANGPPNAVGWAQTGAADFQLFKFNATGVAGGDISVVQTFAGQTLQANTGSLNGDGTGDFSFGI